MTHICHGGSQDPGGLVNDAVGKAVQVDAGGRDILVPQYLGDDLPRHMMVLQGHGHGVPGAVAGESHAGDAKSQSQTVQVFPVASIPPSDVPVQPFSCISGCGDYGQEVVARNLGVSGEPVQLLLDLRRNLDAQRPGPFGFLGLVAFVDDVGAAAAFDEVVGRKKGCVDKRDAVAVVHEQEQSSGPLQDTVVQCCGFNPVHNVLRQISFRGVFLQCRYVESAFAEGIGVFRGFLVLDGFVKNGPQCLDVVLARVAPASAFLQENVKCLDVPDVYL